MVTSPGPCCAVIDNYDFGFGRRAKSVSLLQRDIGAATLWSASQEKTSNAATYGRTARETSLCLDSQRIDQQSHERARGWSSARHGRLPKELDHCSRGARAAELIHTKAEIVPRLLGVVQSSARRNEGTCKYNTSCT